MLDQVTNHAPPSCRGYRFGPFTLDLFGMVLVRDGVRVPLTPKVYEILVLLVTNHDRVLSRDELMQAVWPDTFVEEANLTQNISVLRRVLSDGAADGHYIETLPKHGYRFVAPVREVPEGASPQIEPAGTQAATEEPTTRSWRFSRTALIGAMSLLAAGAAVASLSWWAGRVAHPGMTADRVVRPLAADSPAQRDPAWSPDGRSLAFVGGEGDRGRLMVQRIDDAHATPLTPAGAPLAGAQRPFWSPDSTGVYVISRAINQRGELFKVAATGGEPVPIQKDVQMAALSKDGRALVMLGLEAANWRIFTATPPDGPRHPYRPEPFAAPDYFHRPTLAFAPDGQSILLSITLPSARPQYWLLPWPPGTPKRIFARLPFGRLPNFSWMPDSRHVAFFAYRNQQLYLADTRTEGYWAAGAVDRWPASPSLSPDGTRLAYQAGLSHTDVIGVPVDGGPIVPILDSSLSEEMPALSRVADQVVYVTDRSGAFEIYIRDLQTGADRKLISSNQAPHAVQRVAAPVFSPDGRWVAFRGALSPSQSSILVAPVAGDAPARVVAQAPVQFAPTWSPDGRWLAYVQLVGDTMRLLKVRSDGSGQPVDLRQETAPSRGEMIVPEWSPAGDWIACGDAQNHLMLVRPDGGESRTVGQSCPVAWSADGKALFQVRYEDRSLVKIDLATGRTSVLRDVGNALPRNHGEPARRLTLTRDGTKVVYSVLRPREEIWLLTGLRPALPWLANIWPW